nr:ceramide synthase [Sogatella furcifera]
MWESSTSQTHNENYFPSQQFRDLSAPVIDFVPLYQDFGSLSPTNCFRVSPSVSTLDDSNVIDNRKTQLQKSLSTNCFRDGLSVSTLDNCSVIGRRLGTFQKSGSACANSSCDNSSIDNRNIVTDSGGINNCRSLFRNIPSIPTLDNRNVIDSQTGMFQNSGSSSKNSFLGRDNQNSIDCGEKRNIRNCFAKSLSVSPLKNHDDHLGAFQKPQGISSNNFCDNSPVGSTLDNLNLIDNSSGTFQKQETLTRNGFRDGSSVSPFINLHMIDSGEIYNNQNFSNSPSVSTNDNRTEIGSRRTSVDSNLNNQNFFSTSTLDNITPIDSRRTSVDSTLNNQTFFNTPSISTLDNRTAIDSRRTSIDSTLNLGFDLEPFNQLYRALSHSAVNSYLHTCFASDAGVRCRGNTAAFTLDNLSACVCEDPEDCPHERSRRKKREGQSRTRKTSDDAER